MLSEYLDHITKRPNCFIRQDLRMPEGIDPKVSVRCGVCHAGMRVEDLKWHMIETHKPLMDEVHAKDAALRSKIQESQESRMREVFRVLREAAGPAPLRRKKKSTAPPPVPKPTAKPIAIAPRKKAPSRPVPRPAPAAGPPQNEPPVERALNAPLSASARRVFEARYERCMSAINSTFASLRDIGMRLSANRAVDGGPMQALGLVGPVPDGLVVKNLLLPVVERAVMLGGDSHVANIHHLRLAMMAPGIRWIVRVPVDGGWCLHVEDTGMPDLAVKANRLGIQCLIIASIMDFDRRMYGKHAGLADAWLKDMPLELMLGAKAVHAVGGTKAFHSLWYAGSPVFEIGSTGLRMLRADRESDYMRIDNCGRGALPRVGKGLANWKETGLGEGDFCTDKGDLLPAHLVPHAVRAFEAVTEGRRVMGNGVVHAAGHTAADGPPVAVSRDRPWSQEFLSQLEPTQTINGELIGSGNRYIAFRFDRLVVVEFDADQHATYLFDAGKFDELREWSRSELISIRPKGYRGRIIHRDDPRRWKYAVRAKIREFRQRG
jgi:hypothetical protein